MTPSLRTRCEVCAEPFVRADYPHNIAAWIDPDGMRCAAHASCLERIGERLVSS